MTLLGTIHDSPHLANKTKSFLGADAFYGSSVVTTTQNTEIHELFVCQVQALSDMHKKLLLAGRTGSIVM